jgi:predicted dehydrogenase
MGKAHLGNIRAGKVPGLKVTCVCESHGTIPPLQEGEQAFTDVSLMIKSGLIDAILICTPHFSHTTIGIEALGAGLHVLVEKPISVHKADCERLIAAHTDKTKIFAAMFNMRTNACFKKVKDLIDSGELGTVRRIHWEVTNWFRTNYYYATGGWRGTWKGEGGGVLMNQCPHNLDLFQWMFGMPQKVRGFCQFGRFHEIEVEDDVTAVLQYDNGTTANKNNSTRPSQPAYHLPPAITLSTAAFPPPTTATPLPPQPPTAKAAAYLLLDELLCDQPPLPPPPPID